MKKLFKTLALSVIAAMALAQNSTQMTVVDIAVGNPGFTTLVAAVTQADLVETLSGPGPFTVFAPTDEAFQAALEALGITAEQLLASPDLGAILTYHVLPGQALAADVLAAVEAGGGTFLATTVNGADIVVTVEGGNVILNGVATVLVTDLLADNGVVHVIDAVLLPPTE